MEVGGRRDGAEGGGKPAREETGGREGARREEAAKHGCGVWGGRFRDSIVSKLQPLPSLSLEQNPNFHHP
eukprot:2676267-Rhodomonas_salina.1